MNPREAAARIEALELLVEMLVREMPLDQQSDLTGRLIDRVTGRAPLEEIAEQWDRRILRGRSENIDFVAERRRRETIFGPDEPPV